MFELFTALESGTLREVFCTGASAVIMPPARIGWQGGGGGGGGADEGTAEGGIEVQVQAADVDDIVFPVVGTSDGPSDVRKMSGQ